MKRKRVEEVSRDAGSDGDDDDGASLASAADDAVAAGVVVPPPPKQHINNRAGLRQALTEFRQEGLPWIERLEVVSAEPLGAVDVNDDLKMELGLCVAGPGGAYAGSGHARGRGRERQHARRCRATRPFRSSPRYSTSLPPHDAATVRRSPPSSPRAASSSARASLTSGRTTSSPRCSRAMRT